MTIREQAKTLWDSFAQKKKLQERQVILTNLVVAAYNTYVENTDSTSSFSQKSIYYSTNNTIKILVAIQNCQYNDPIWDEPSVMRDLAFLFIGRNISESCFLQGLFSVMMRQKITACEETQPLLTDDDKLTPEADLYLDKFVKLLKSELFGENNYATDFNINKELLVELLKQLPKHEAWLGSYDFLKKDLDNQTLSGDILYQSAVYNQKANKHYYLLPSLAVLDAILLSIIGFAHQPYLPFHKDLSMKEFMDAQTRTDMRPCSFVLDNKKLYAHFEYLENIDLLIHDIFFHVIINAERRAHLPATFHQEMLLSAELNQKFDFEFTNAAWNMHDVLEGRKDAFFMTFLLLKGLSSTQLSVIRPDFNIEPYRKALTTNSVWEALSEHKKFVALYIIYNIAKDDQSFLLSKAPQINDFLMILSKENAANFTFIRNHLENSNDDVALQILDGKSHPINRMRITNPLDEIGFVKFIFYYYISKVQKTTLASNSSLFSAFIKATQDSFENSIKEFIALRHFNVKIQRAHFLYLKYGDIFIQKIQGLADSESQDFRSILPVMVRFFPKDFLQWVDANNVLEVTANNNDYLSLGDIFNNVYQKDANNFIQNAHKALAAYSLKNSILDTNYNCDNETTKFLCLMRILLEHKQTVYFSEINMLAKIIHSGFSFFDIETIFPRILWNKIPQTLDLNSLKSDKFLGGISDFLKTAASVKVDVDFFKIILDKLMGHMYTKFPEISTEIHNLIITTKEILKSQISNKPKISYLETLATQIKQHIDLQNQPKPQ